MASIDERVVSMAFENAKFEAGIAQTLRSLQKLNDTLAQVGSVNGLADIEKSANKVTLSGPMAALDKLRSAFGHGVDTKPLTDIEKAGEQVTLSGPMRALDKLRSVFSQGVDPKPIQDLERASNLVTLDGAGKAIDGVSLKLGAMQTAATVAFGTLVSQATMAAGNLAKKLSLGPITEGLEEYTTNLNSIQTILANTEQSGATLVDVNKALAELNDYSDQTIYNFSQMAKNIGTFTAAGVDLERATASIKGIANLAALGGANANQAATAMYQLSQEISAGRVSLQGWNSVVNAGMGGVRFQGALVRTAQNMGTLEKGAVKVKDEMGNLAVNGQSFRESIMARPGEESWMTSDVLVNTLQQMTGDMTEAQLAAEGFTGAQIKEIQSMAETAKQAATQVKTISGVFEVVQESIGSGWAQTFQIIFGDFEEAKTLFTGVTSYITDWTGKVSDARNQMLSDWKEAGGRENLLGGLQQGAQNLLDILGAVSKAFRDVFPKTTGAELADLTARFANFMRELKPSPQLLDQIRRIFAGVFAVFSIGKTIVTQVFGVFGRLIGVLGKSSGGVLGFVASIGDFLVAVDAALGKGEALRGVFDTLEAVLAGPIALLKALGNAILNIFGLGDDDEASTLGAKFAAIGDGLSPLGPLADKVVAAWQKLVEIFDRIAVVLQPLFDVVKEQIKRFTGWLEEAFSADNFDRTLEVLQTGLFAGILLILRRFKDKLEVTFGGDLMENVSNSFKALTGNLVAMQRNIQAKTLLTIAGAIVALAAGIYLLSTINPEKLGTAMTAVAVGLGQLVGAMALLTKVGGGLAGLAVIPVLASSMVLLAGAMVVLAAAVKIFSTMSWEELARGLAGVGGGLVAIGTGLKFIGPAALIQGPALLIIAVALNVLAAAVKQFSEIGWEEMARGVLAVGLSLASMGAGLSLVGPSLLLIGPGLVAAALGMNMLAGAVSAFGSMDLEVLAKGIGGVAVALAAIGVAILAIPPTVALQGAGLIVLATGLTGLSAAIAILGTMSVGKLVKGIIAMGGALVVLGIGLTAMSGTLIGSAALLAAAAAFAILAPTLGFMGNLSWGTIVKGLIAIAATLGVLAIAGLVVAPPILALSVALGALGIALGLVTTPIYILAKALEVLGATGTQGIGVMVAALTAFVLVLPKLVIDFVKGLLSIIEEVAKLTPRVVEAIHTILDQIIAIVVESTPKLAVALITLVDSFSKVILAAAPKLFDTGVALLGQLLSGIARNIGRVVAQAATLVTRFLDSLRGEAPRISAAGAGTLTAFLVGIANNLGKVIAGAAKVVYTFLRGLVQHIPKVVDQGAAVIVKFMTGIASKIGEVIESGVGFILALLKGIGQAVPKIVAEAIAVAGKFVTGVARGLVRLVDIGYKAVIDFLNGVADAIRENGPELRAAGWNVADAILDGMVDGFSELGNKALDAIKSVMGGLPKAAKSVLGIRSPSKVFQELGKFTAMGLAVGIGEGGKDARKSSEGLGHAVIDQFKETFKIRSPSQVMREIGEEVGRGFKQGLEGSVSEIRNSFRYLNDRIRDEMRTAREGIKAEQANLAQLRSEDKPDLKAIAASEKALAQHQQVLRRMVEAQDTLKNELDDEKASLIKLTKDYEKVTEQLDLAQQALDDITRTRDEAIAGYTEQYSRLPDINKDVEDSVEDYKQQLREQIQATKTFYETMQKLRELGLDDATYKKLLAEGLGSADFAKDLLQGGKASIDQINTLDAQLLEVSANLGLDAARNLYQAGVDAAQGLVDGLNAKQAELQAVMDRLAARMVSAIKAALKIRSPSQVFVEIAKLATEGLAKGFRDSAGMAGDAVKELGVHTVSAMKQSVADISRAIAENIEVDPVITPVLDLSALEQEAKKLDELVNVVPITAAASYGQASAISQEATAAAEVAQAESVVPQINLEQNNYSPEALSEVEIYRQTNNQLSQLKGALGLAT